MTDEGLTEEFISAHRGPSELVLRVKTIKWEGPHTPVAEWITARTITGSLTDSEVQDSVRALLADRSFFGKCEECGERNPMGWMHNPSLCQGCAEGNHGVVY